jgi:hypothetical protein
MTKIKAAHMNLIVERIHQGRCVPFLGAAANVKTKGYPGLPLGKEVAAQLIKLKAIEFFGKNPEDLGRVALQCEFETDRDSLITSLQDILPDKKRKPSPLLRTLAQLPFSLVITTNYDRLLEEALKGEKIECIVQPAGGFPDTPEHKKRFEALEEFDGLVIYKIHGSFLEGLGAEELPPLIITEDDYIEFLTVVGLENIGVPRIILKKIIPSTLLFLGYSLEDWDFRTIYKGVIERLPRHHRRRSFAIQNDAPEFWVSFWRTKGVEVYNMDLYDFAKQLEASYHEKYG